MPNPFTVGGTNDTFSYIGPDKEIVVGAGTSTLNIQKVYSIWKTWVLEGNAQYLPAWRPVGGDDLGGDNRVAFYGFLANGWRVRLPAELQSLFVTGGILSTEELDNPFRFDGVLVTLQQPVAVQFVSSVQTDKILKDIEESRYVNEKVIAPEVYATRNTVEKTLAPSVLSVLSPVSNVLYDFATGITTVTTNVANHNLEVNDRVHLVGIAMTCDTDQGETTVIFPDIELGSGTYPNSNDIKQPYVFNIVDVPSANEFTIQAGITTFNHYYSGGGVVSRFTADLIADQVNVGINTIPATTSSPSELDKIRRNTNLIPALQ